MNPSVDRVGMGKYGNPKKLKGRAPCLLTLFFSVEKEVGFFFSLDKRDFDSIKKKSVLKCCESCSEE